MTEKQQKIDGFLESVRALHGAAVADRCAQIIAATPTQEFSPMRILAEAISADGAIREVDPAKLSKVVFGSRFRSKYRNEPPGQ